MVALPRLRSLPEPATPPSAAQTRFMTAYMRACGVQKHDYVVRFEVFAGVKAGDSVASSDCVTEDSASQRYR
jgi:hypothetical protein